MIKELNEPILEDDYPIYAGYLYVADGKVVRSDWHGITARQFRNREGIRELRRCDIAGRRCSLGERRMENLKRTTFTLAALVQEIRCALLDQATDKKLTAQAHRRRCMKLRNKIAAFYGQQ